MQSTTANEELTDPAPRRIKRYANRKLYDTRDSRYVTLHQIAQYVRDGEDVAIIDNRTKEDLTNVTLAQIIYEEEKKGNGPKRTSTSVGTLRALIQESGERLMTTLRDGPVGKLIARKEEGEEDAGGQPVAESPEPPRRSVFASSKEAFDELQRLADDQIRGLIGHAIDRVHALQGEVGRLQDRIEDLETKLVALQGSEDARSAGSGAGAESPD